MAIEIRELVIRVTVETLVNGASGTATLSADELDRLKKEIVQACLAKLSTGPLLSMER